MGRKFLAVIGNRQNSDCIYTYNDKQESTCFVQEAIVKIMCKNWSKDDKVVIFLTEDARITNWEGKNKLKERLQTANPNIEIIDKSIKEANNEEEIAEVFEVIYNSFETGDEIIFDITNAFRYLPMMALSVINFVSQTKDIKVSGIYYGKFQGENKEAPILDLTDLYKMINLTYKLKEKNYEYIEEEITEDINPFINLAKAYKRCYKEALGILE